MEWLAPPVAVVLVAWLVDVWLADRRICMTPLQRIIVDCSGIDEAELDTDVESDVEPVEITERWAEWQGDGEPVGATK